jgi:hypothetical protein
MTQESEITEILSLIHQNLSVKELMEKYSVENISTAYWIAEQEQIVEIEEDFEILNKK